MTNKIADMTPTELARYEKEKKKNAARMKAVYAARRADPKWIDRQRTAQRKYNSKRSKRPAVKKANAERMREKYRSDPIYREQQKAYWEVRRNDPSYKPIRLAKQREYSRRYKAEKRLNEEFAAFMSRIDMEGRNVEQGQ